jgi:hypothetical protein
LKKSDKRENPCPPLCPPGNARFPPFVGDLSQSVHVIVPSGATCSREAKRPSGESAS